MSGHVTMFYVFPYHNVYLFMCQVYAYFSVTFCFYVLQLLNISKALTGEFIQTGEFSITG